MRPGIASSDGAGAFGIDPEGGVVLVPSSGWLGSGMGQRPRSVRQASRRKPILINAPASAKSLSGGSRMKHRKQWHADDADQRQDEDGSGRMRFLVLIGF